MPAFLVSSEGQAYVLHDLASYQAIVTTIARLTDDRIAPKQVQSDIGAVRDSLALTLAATLTTAPVCAAAFGQASAITLVANLLVAPAFPLICIGGFASVAATVLLGSVGEALLCALLVPASST